MVCRFATSLRTHCHRALPGKLKFEWKGAEKTRSFRIGFAVYIKLLIVEIRISPATTRSSAEKAAAKLSE